MFVLRYLALAAIAAAGADAFVAPGALPMQRARVTAQSGLSLIRCQGQEASKVVKKDDGVKPVATGGTDFSSIPKKKVRTTSGICCILYPYPAFSVPGLWMSSAVPRDPRLWLASLGSAPKVPSLIRYSIECVHVIRLNCSINVRFGGVLRLTFRDAHDDT
jgi:hypothetical protein